MKNSYKESHKGDRFGGLLDVFGIASVFGFSDGFGWSTFFCEEHAAWLASPSTSIAMCRAGDVMLFWGGVFRGL